MSSVETGDPTSPLSSTRTTEDLDLIATNMGAIWAQAGIAFAPISTAVLEVPGDALAATTEVCRATRSVTSLGYITTSPAPTDSFSPAPTAPNSPPSNKRSLAIALKEFSMRPDKQTSRQFVGILALAIIAAACGSGGSDPTAGSASTSGLPLSIPNTGTTDVEGHTPQGFAGSGVGLFVGDNLNADFPEGEGVQLWLTFDLGDLAEGALEQATITSEALSTSGTPFDDLGALRVAPVVFQSFGPEVFDIEPAVPATECSRSGESSLSCDATDAVQQALDNGAGRVQFRMRFDTPGDSDGSQDLAMFFLTDSNTNEPGIFTLELA